MFDLLRYATGKTLTVSESQDDLNLLRRRIFSPHSTCKAPKCTSPVSRSGKSSLAGDKHHDSDPNRMALIAERLFAC